VTAYGSGLRNPYTREECLKKGDNMGVILGGRRNCKGAIHKKEIIDAQLRGEKLIVGEGSDTRLRKCKKK
jgi:hypothetical protein